MCVKQKIMGLLNISKDDAASEAEIETALRLANKLMDRHHLSEGDLDDAENSALDRAVSSEKKQGHSVVGKKMYMWEKVLTHFVSDLVGVPHYLSRGVMDKKTASGLVFRDINGKAVRGRSVVFYGVAEDVDIAVSLYDELRLVIIALARLRYGSVFQGEGGVYSEGFVSGLRSNLKKDKAEQKRLAQGSSDERALVLIDRRNDLIRIKSNLASKWLKKEKGINLVTKSTRGGASGSSDARNAGRADGRGYNVSAARRRKLS